MVQLVLHNVKTKRQRRLFEVRARMAVQTVKFALVLLLCLFSFSFGQLPSEGSSGGPPRCRTSPCIQGFCSAYYALNAIHSNGSCSDVYSNRYCDFCQSCLSNDFAETGSGTGVCESDYAYFCSFIPPDSCSDGVCSDKTCSHCQNVRNRCTLPANPIPDICSMTSSIARFCRSLRNNPICSVMTGTPYCEFCSIYDNICTSIDFSGNVSFPVQVCDYPFLHSSCSTLNSMPVSECSALYPESLCYFCDTVGSRCPSFQNPPSLDNICNSTIRVFCQTLSVTSDYCTEDNSRADCSICRLVNVMCPSLLTFFDTCSQSSTYLCRSVVQSSCQLSSELCVACQHYLGSCGNTTGSQADFCQSEVSQICNSIPTGPSCQYLASQVSPGFSIFCSLCETYVDECGVMACNDSSLVQTCENSISDLTQRQTLSPQQCSPCNLIIGLCSSVRKPIGNNNVANSSIDFLQSVIPNPEECRRSPCLQSFCSPTVITRITNHPCEDFYHPDYCSFCDSCEDFSSGSGNGTINPMCSSTMALRCALTTRYLPCYALYGNEYCTSCKNVLNQCPELNFPANFFPMEVCDQPILLSGCSVLSNNPSCSSMFGEEACQFCRTVADRCPPLTNPPTLADLCFNTTFRTFCQSLSVPFPNCQTTYSNADCSLCQIVSSMCPSNINFTFLDTCSHASVYTCRSVVNSGCDISSELCTACQSYLQLCPNTTGNRTDICNSEVSQICSSLPSGPACRSLVSAASPSFSIVCSLCDLYIQDCGEFACNNSQFVEFCYQTISDINQRQILSPQQCSPCNLIVGLCSKIRSGRSNNTNGSLAIYESLVPTQEECMSSPCLHSFCLPDIITRNFNLSCNDVYSAEYCTFCNSCQGLSGGNDTTNTSCTSSVARSCAVTRYLPCYAIFGRDYCNSCNQLLERCPNLNLPENFFPTEACDQPVLRSICGVLSNRPDCTSVYNPELCQFCSAVTNRCPPLTSLPSLTDLCFNSTIHSFCQTLSFPLPRCEEVYNNTACSLCQLFNNMCPLSINITSNILDSCSQASSYFCRSVVQSACDISSELCMACGNYLQLCSNITGNQTNFCYSEAAQICGNAPSGPACQALTSSIPGLSIVCSMCDLYVQDCGEIACNDNDVVDMCRNSLNSLGQEHVVPIEQCSPCSLIFGICPLVRSQPINVTGSTPYSALRSLIPTSEECQRSPCLLSLCSPVAFSRHANVPCDSTYHPDYCDFCESCQGISSGSGNGNGNATLDLLCTSPIVSSCAISTRILPCNALFGNDYCNFCQGILNQCSNVNISDINLNLPVEICENPVLRSGCSLLSGNPNCQQLYPEQACQLCNTFEARCPPNNSPTLQDLCSNDTLRSTCQTLVSTSLPYCGDAFPSQDCGLCKTLNTVCPSNLSMMLINLDTCSQASSYICRSVVESGCQTLPPQVCMGCQQYLQMCANTTGSQEQFCMSEVSHICGTIPNGPACRSLVSTAYPDLSILCSLCEFYVEDCSEVACNDTNLVDMCHNELTDLNERQVLTANQCSPCNLIMGLCPVLRSGRIAGSGSTPLSVLRSFIPTPDECQSSPCLQGFCLPVSFTRHTNIPCESVYHQEYCQFCDGCLENDNSTVMNPLCTTPIASTCAITNRVLSCNELFGEEYCNFCDGVVGQCQNLNNFSRTDGYLPREICTNPVIRSGCDIFTSHPNCSMNYPREACQFCNTFQSQCPSNTTLPTLGDLCANQTLRGYCQKLVSTSFPYCADAYPTRDCSLCQLVNSVCPSNLTAILTDLNTCSQPSTYLCSAVMQSDCQTFSPEFCMGCQAYVQRCGNESYDRREFCSSEASEVCASIPSGPACRAIASSVSSGLSVFCSLCELYTQDCGEIACNQSDIVNMCFDTITNVSTRQTSSPQICSPCNLIVRLCSGIQPEVNSIPSFPQALIPTAQECAVSPCLQSFCLPTTFSRHFNVRCEDSYSQDYCSFCESCQGFSSGDGSGVDPRCMSPIASACSITARYLPCYATFGSEYCNACKDLLEACPNITYPENTFPTDVCGQPLLRSACSIFPNDSSCSPSEACEFCNQVDAMCPPVSTLPSISELCANETMRDFCQTLSISFPHCSEVYTNADCSLCQLLNSVCPSNITMFDTCIPESIYVCRSIIQAGCHLSSELCMACRHYVEMCPNTTGRGRNQFCQSDITNICGSIPTATVCTALAVNVPEVRIFCSFCQFYVEDCGQLACSDQDLVNFCFDSINDLNRRQILSPQQCSPCNLIIGLCPQGTRNSSLLHPNTTMPTPEECNASPCLQSFCTPTVITHQVNLPCENFYHDEYCSFCESCLGIGSGSGVDPACVSPLAASCAINARYLPCFSLFGNEYCENCRNILDRCPNLNLPNNFFPQEACGQPLLLSGCTHIANNTDCTSEYSREACQFCDVVADSCPGGVELPSISNLCFNSTLRGFCQTLSISFPLCAQAYSNADCSLCQLINRQCPMAPGNCTNDYSGLFCRLIGRDMNSCLERFTPATCQSCAAVAERCGTLEEADLSQSQLTTLCALRSTCTFFPLSCGHQAEILCDYCNFLRSNQGTLSCPTGPMVPSFTLLSSTVPAIIPMSSSSQATSSTPVVQRPMTTTRIPIPSTAPTLPPDTSINSADLNEEQRENSVTIGLSGVTREDFFMTEENFRETIANGLNSRRRQTRVTADQVVIIKESVRMVDGTLQVAFFVMSPEGGVVSGERLADAVRQEEEQIAASVGASGVSMVEQGVPTDLPTVARPQINPGLPVGITLAVVIVVGIAVAVVVVVIVFYMRQKRTTRYPVPKFDPESTDDEERYMDSAGLVSKMSDKKDLEASEMQEKKPLLVPADVTTITNETALDAEDEDKKGEESEKNGVVEPGSETKEITFF